MIFFCRRDSRKLPIGDPDVDWEETVCLNLVIHLFDYKITLAICTRTSPNNLQVLRRASQKVYASPSHRRMDSKSDGEEMIFPYVCFSVDNFDEAFSDIMVNSAGCIRPHNKKLFKGKGWGDGGRRACCHRPQREHRGRFVPGVCSV